LTLLNHFAKTYRFTARCPLAPFKDVDVATASAISILRRLFSIVGLAILACPASGAPQSRPEVEILSKSDTILLFRLTKQQWLNEIKSGVARGAKRLEDPLMPGMATQTPEGDFLSVRLDYSKGEKKPFFIQVAIGYRANRAALFTDQMLRDVVAGAAKQMAPEFELDGDFELFPGGADVFFDISESPRQQRR
jgi:hypothetical protein